MAAAMTWEQACDRIDNLVYVMACIDDERGNYPALTYYERQMTEAERQLDKAFNADLGAMDPV